MHRRRCADDEEAPSGGYKGSQTEKGEKEKEMERDRWIDIDI